MSKKSAKKSAAATPTIAVCQSVGVDFHVHQFPHGNDNFGEEAVPWLLEYLGVALRHTFKTFIIELSDKHIGLAIAAVPATRMPNFKAVVTTVRASKVTMADPHDVSLAIGYISGGISPFGGRRKLPTVIGETATLADTVFISSDRRGWDIELSPVDLVLPCGATVASIAR